MFTVFVDKQNKERILEEFFFLFTHKIRTETEPKPWPKKRFTDSTVSYLYRCNPNLLPTVLQEFSVPMATVHHSCVCSAAYFHPVSLQKVLPFLFFCCSAFVCTCSLDPGLARVRWRTWDDAGLGEPVWPICPCLCPGSVLPDDSTPAPPQPAAKAPRMAPEGPAESDLADSAPTQRTGTTSLTHWPITSINNAWSLPLLNWCYLTAQTYCYRTRGRFQVQGSLLNPDQDVRVFGSGLGVLVTWRMCSH